jgi:hypothetical protein
LRRIEAIKTRFGCAQPNINSSTAISSPLSFRYLSLNYRDRTTEFIDLVQDANQHLKPFRSRQFGVGIARYWVQERPEGFSHRRRKTRHQAANFSLDSRGEFARSL